MTTAEILAAAANRIEAASWDAQDAEFSVGGVIAYVSPDVSSTLKAIRYFARFVRADGIVWEREPGRTQAEVVRALRDAAQSAVPS